MKKKNEKAIFLFKYSEERKWYINLLIMICCLLGMIVIPSVVAAVFMKFITNSAILQCIGTFVFLLLLILIFYKDLSREIATFLDNFESIFFKSIKYYALGMVAMVVFSLIIYSVLGDTSANENTVRDYLVKYPIWMMIDISILAPLTEEIVFRKSIAPVIKNNKWIYALVCGILFGLAHLLTNFVSGTFVISDLLYLLPYGSLGFVFALMDYENKSVFSSVMIHSIHNTFSGVLILISYAMGVL